MQNIKRDRAILVGVNINETIEETKKSLDELKQLALAVFIETKDTIIQSVNKISPKYYIGSGKVEELKQIIRVLDIDIVIFNDPLSPSQIKNLELALDVQIIDRSFLILDIFARRAKTKAATLEVSLAQKLYLYPRLVGMSKSLSRQGGGSYNAKGPGETKLELDRRKLLTEIYQIKLELDKIKKERETARKKRKNNHIPVVALVGYTNAGKSSLMNSLSTMLNHKGDAVLEENMLFSTLDTKSKRLQKNNYPPFILIDTVGFVSKLPTELISSFESTLSDVIYADLIIHVVDGANFNTNQIETTKSVLNNIGASHIERLLVLTKKEISLFTPTINEDYIFISNRTKENIDVLIDAIYGHLYQNSIMCNLFIPFDKGNIYSDIKRKYTILETRYENDGLYAKVILNKNNLKEYKPYIIN